MTTDLVSRTQIMPDLLDPSPGLHSDSPAAAAAKALADQLQLAAMAVNRTRMPMVITEPQGFVRQNRS